MYCFQNKVALRAVVGLFVCLSSEAKSQATDSVRVLRQVLVRGIGESRFAVGSTTCQLDSLIVSRLSGSSLGELLMRQSTLYMRQYGAGMLASISMRGTGPSQTALFWNGINLNLPTLGQIDYSTVPIFAGNNIIIQPGSQSALYGSDAIGGTVHITQQLGLKQGRQVSLQQEIGSFSRYFTHLQATASHSTWQAQANFYQLYHQNDFPFRNIAKAGAPIERQQNAATHYWGVMPQCYWQPDNKRQFSLKAWYHHHWRQVQPTMAAQEVRDQQQDENFRLVADYEQLSGRKGILRLKSAWVFDEIVFNASRSTMKRYLGQMRHQWDWSPNFTTEIGSQLQHAAAKVNAYGKEVHEQRADWFALARFCAKQSWLFSATIRQTIVPGFSAPVAPALGIQWQDCLGEKHSLTWKVQISKGYRVPTLNDRFWQPGGKPNLRPEHSYNAETTFTWKGNAKLSSLQGTITLFRLWVRDWILWLPQGSFWSPENARQVRVTGAEAHVSYQRFITKGFWRAEAHYAFNQSLNLYPLSSNDRSAGKQLPYTPLHRAFAAACVFWRQWLVQMDVNYTGLRYPTADNETWLEPFTITNLLISKDWQLKRWRLQALFRLNNLFNTSYQNFQLRAMPGRHFQASIMVQTNFNNW
ncbi:MAG: TonB-dependent receptor [Cytophagales bacterium]|nr:TonB-dependent receptor [Bernardetiaceae bacterium]MDW8210126.1 TonB-dependent receptor [Cytophagales bacterium]